MGLQQNVRLLSTFLLCASVCLWVSCGAFPHRPGYDRALGAYPDQTPNTTVKGHWEGNVSYYGKGFHGKKTANGERFDQMAKTCAHRTLPFGTLLKITLKKTGKSVVVRVNDRGPYKDNRLVDLSYGAAKEIGLDLVGVGQATIETVH